MEVLTDHDAKSSIRLPIGMMYYPLGVDNSYYCVLKFTITGGHFYREDKTEGFQLTNTNQ